MKVNRAVLFSIGAVLLALSIFIYLYWSVSSQREGATASIESTLEEQIAESEPEAEEKPVELLIYQATARRPGRPYERKVTVELATSSNPANRAVQIVNAAVKELASMLPANAVEQVYLLENGTAVVDFSRDGASRIRGGATDEYSILLTLTRSLKNNLEEVDRVRFLVGGLEEPTLSGHISLATPFR